jgi:hypothetical protein
MSKTMNGRCENSTFAVVAATVARFARQRLTVAMVTVATILPHPSADFHINFRV